MKPTNKEQELCVNCGMCCDNTLFDIVIIQPNDDVPEKLIEREVFQDGNHYFKLPCPYFIGCCSIYDQAKPQRCSEFICSLLKKVQKEDISKTQAQKIIREILVARDKIIHDYAIITGKKLTFLEIYRELAKSENEVKEMPIELKTVHYMSNLLHVQLAKWFRAPEDFEKFYHVMS